MFMPFIYVVLTCLFTLMTGCAAGVEDACDNLADRCELSAEQRDKCVTLGEQREEDEEFAEGELDCIAEAETCEAAASCGPQHDNTSADAGE